jgi:pimeloyl-ACP methyl ester carboxylesterase
MRTHILSALLVAAMLVIARPALAQDAPIGTPFTTEAVACPDFINDGAAFNPSPAMAGALGLGEETEGETYDCGVVYVPENYDEPDGRTIELFYLRLRSTSQSPAPDPLIYLAGGPGSSGSFELSGIPITLSNMNKVRERRDIIGYDQRGTGFSNYLLCAPFLSTLGVVMDRVDNPDDAAIVEQGMNDPLVVDALKGSICAVVYNELTDVDLAQYNSVVSAQDIRHVAEALGYTEGYNLYGTSYGTRLAQYAMRATPEAVRSVLIDGVLPVDMPNVAVTFATFYHAYDDIFAQCAANAACNATYPDLPARFAALLQKLEANPLVLDPPLVVSPAWPLPGMGPVIDQITPDFFLSIAMSNNINLDGGLAKNIPGWIADFEAGDTSNLRSQIGIDAPPPALGSAVMPPTAQPLPFEPQQPLFQLPLTALLNLAKQARAATSAGIDDDWTSIVLQDFQTRLLAGQNQDDLIADLVVFSVLPTNGTDAQALIDFATARLTPTAAQSANALVAQMSRDDVRTAMWTIQDIAMHLGTQELRSDSLVMQNAVNCAEDVAFSSLEDSRAYLDSSPYPQLALWPWEANERALAPCLAFPKPLDESVTELVKSDIPTLLYLSALDVQTPMPWGHLVADELSTAYTVEWNNMGHIAAAHDIHACAGDIAAAFFDNPTREPNVNCAQADRYQLHFVLP